jgi:hypothetical protein
LGMGWEWGQGACMLNAGMQRCVAFLGVILASSSHCLGYRDLSTIQF